MRKKTYFIGVTHEIDGRMNYSIVILGKCKISRSYSVKKTQSLDWAFVFLGFYSFTTKT